MLVGLHHVVEALFHPLHVIRVDKAKILHHAHAVPLGEITIKVDNLFRLQVGTDDVVSSHDKCSPYDVVGINGPAQGVLQTPIDDTVYQHQEANNQ